MGRTNPAARYREMGAELRKVREGAGLQSAELAHKTGWSRAKISRIESGRDELDEVDLVHYLGICKVNFADVLGIRLLCREAGHRLGHWVDPHETWLSEAGCSLIYHESTASASTSYEPLLIPGLLQTEAYIRALCSERRPNQDADTSVRIRLARQHILRRPERATFMFFVHENALRLTVGQAAVMHEQLLALTFATALSNVTIRVVPAGVRSVFGGAFRMLQYADHRPLVFLDAYVSGGIFLEDFEYVEPYRELVPAIKAVALDEGQSREFIAMLASEYDRERPTHRAAIYQLEEEQL